MKSAAVKYGGVPERVGAQMTRAQASRLKSLAEEAYQPRQYARDLSFEEAERRINAFKAEIALADSFQSEFAAHASARDAQALARTGPKASLLRYGLMTDEERQLLKDTAENLLLLLRQWDDTIAGMQVAISELYRAGMMTPERKALALSRLKIRRDLMSHANKPTQYLDGLIDELDKWNSH